MEKNRPIYLDYNATTPHAPEVVEAISSALETGWGNPSSDHAYGSEAAKILNNARKQVADLLNCAPHELIFTSGGTESDNTALIGCAEALESRGKHIVTSTIEHPAVEAPCVYLQQRGWEVTRVGILPNGTVDPNRFVDAFRDDTTVATLMHAHNETGVIQPIPEIARETRRRGIVFHTDAAQTVGKLNVDVEELGVDLLTLAGHKLYGPRGIGALFVREGSSFGIYHHGAGHENGRRAGTENIPGIAGLGAASELARETLLERLMHLARLRSMLENELRRRIPDLVIHGMRAARLPNTTFCSIPGIDGRAIVQIGPLLQGLQDRQA
jgi:cysteine desulfurase